MMNASSESHVFISYYDKLQKLIQGEVQNVAAKSLAKHLLSSGEHSKCTHLLYTAEQQAAFFMQAVRNKIEVDADNFYTFVGILKKEPSHESMAKKLEQEVATMKSQHPGQPQLRQQGFPSDDAEFDFNFVADTKLDIDDAFDVVELIERVAEKFYALGQALRINSTQLSIIKNRWKDDPVEGLRAVIEEWLNNGTKPTWRSLAKAVNHPIGGANRAVARAIANKHPVQTGQPSS